MLIVPPVEDMRERDPHLYDSLKRIIDAINNLANQLGADPKPAAGVKQKGAVEPPNPPASISVSGRIGIFSIQLAPGEDNSQPINYFVQRSNTPDFASPITTQVADTLRVDLSVGTAITQYFRAYAQYPKSEQSDYVVYGAPPIAVSSGNISGGAVSAADVRRLVEYVIRDVGHRSGDNLTNFRQIARLSSGVFVIGSDQSNVLLRSPDGINWSNVAPDPTRAYTTVASSGTLLAIVEGFTGNIYTSPDGINWTLKQNIGISANKIRYYSGVWLAVPLDATGETVWRSQDDWETMEESSGIADGNDFNYDIAFDGTTYVLIQQDKRIWTSTDFHTWTARSNPAGSGVDLWVIAYSPELSRFVIGGQSGTLMYSDDSGATWTKAVTTYANAVPANGELFWNGREFLVGTSDSRLMVSAQGIYWHLHYFGGDFDDVRSIYDDGADIRVLAGNVSILLTRGI